MFAMRAVGPRKNSSCGRGALTVVARNSWTAAVAAGVPAIAVGAQYLHFVAKRADFARRFAQFVRCEPYGTVELSVHGLEKFKACSFSDFRARQARGPLRPLEALRECPNVVLFFHDGPGGADQYPCIHTLTGFEFPFPTITVARPGYNFSDLLRRVTMTEVCWINHAVLKQLLAPPPAAAAPDASGADGAGRAAGRDLAAQSDEVGTRMSLAAAAGGAGAGAPAAAAAEEAGAPALPPQLPAPPRPPASSLGRRIHVVGLGRGALYALLFARLHGDCAASLTLLSGQTRLDGLRARNPASGQFTHYEGDRLQGMLNLMAYSRSSAIASGFAEMMTVYSLRRRARRAYHAVFVEQFAPETPAPRWEDLVDLLSRQSEFFFPAQSKRFEAPFAPNSITGALCLMRAVGKGHSVARRLGLINDLCNTSNVELCLDGLKKPTSYRRRTKSSDSNNSERSAAEDGKSAAKMHPGPEESRAEGVNEAASAQAGAAANSDGSGTAPPWSVQSIMAGIEQAAEKMRAKKVEGGPTRMQAAREEIELTAGWDNESALAALSSDIPALILHSPHDGVIDFNKHAAHAAKCIANARLETLDLHPHVLPFKNTEVIQALIHQHMYDAASAAALQELQSPAERPAECENERAKKAKIVTKSAFAM